jgi:hypothetical protein
MQKLNQQEADMLTLSIAQIEKCISACQNLVDMCSVNNGPECAEAVGLCVKHCNECIEGCTEVMAWCQSQLDMVDTSRRNLYEKCIKVCKSTIQHCSKTIAQCKAGQEGCIQLCLDCITHCTAAAQACSSLID